MKKYVLIIREDGKITDTTDFECDTLYAALKIAEQHPAFLAPKEKDFVLYEAVVSYDYDKDSKNWSVNHSK